MCHMQQCCPKWHAERKKHVLSQDAPLLHGRNMAIVPSIRKLLTKTTRKQEKLPLNEDILNDIGRIYVK